jgi:hypothetical protein
LQKANFNRNPLDYDFEPTLEYLHKLRKK